MTATPLEAGTARRRILVVTEDTLSSAMAGAAIRAWNIAAALADQHEVWLASTTEATVGSPAFRVDHLGTSALRDAVKWADILITQGWVLARDQALLEGERVLVVDLYDPMHLEQLEQGHEAGDARGRIRAVSDVTAVLNESLLHGDFFVCASERQRSFWLGQLAGLGRINPAVYDDDPTLRSFLDVVPFGLSGEPPTRTGPGAKGIIEGISDGDRLILWGGGVYNWFDPLTLLRAVDRLRTRVDNVRLLFLGLRHPNPAIPEMRMAAATRDLAAELGLTGRHVFFNEQWVRYDDRQNYLLDAEVGVSTHLHHVETEFSSRTRLLDYIWAGLPIVATSGDALSDMVEADGLGITVPPHDEAALADALERMLTDAELVADCKRNLACAAERLRWSHVMRPLVAFCAQPHVAPDRADPIQARALGPRVGVGPSTGLRRDVRVLKDHLAEGGIRLAARRARSRLVRLLRRS